jgi:hypothetical protein
VHDFVSHLNVLNVEPTYLLFCCYTIGNGGRKIADLPAALTENFLRKHNRAWSSGAVEK